MRSYIVPALILACTSVPAMAAETSSKPSEVQVSTAQSTLSSSQIIYTDEDTITVVHEFSSACNCPICTGIAAANSAQ